MSNFDGSLRDEKITCMVFSLLIAGKSFTTSSNDLGPCMYKFYHSKTATACIPRRISAIYPSDSRPRSPALMLFESRVELINSRHTSFSHSLIRGRPRSCGKICREKIPSERLHTRFHRKFDFANPSALSGYETTSLWLWVFPSDDTVSVVISCFTKLSWNWSTSFRSSRIKENCSPTKHVSVRLFWRPIERRMRLRDD